MIATKIVLTTVLIAVAEALGADPGVTDKEIKIGNIMPYSGPASSYGTIGRGISAYFKRLNEEGGINGRKINIISYDDGYSPPRAVEQSRRLVGQNGGLLPAIPGPWAGSPPIRPKPISTRSTC